MESSSQLPQRNVIRVRMTAPKKRSLGSQPVGKDEVKSAIISAARDLFAQKGFAAVSIRDIASAACVNHGLVHRHFGTKDAVLHAVLQGMFSDVTSLARAGAQIDSPDFIPRLYPLVAARKQDWQILMRAVLDGFDFQTSGFEFPLTAAVQEHVAARRGGRNESSRTVAGAIIAGGLGWLLLESYLTPILKLDSVDTEKLRKRIAGLYSSLVDA